MNSDIDEIESKEDSVSPSPEFVAKVKSIIDAFDRQDLKFVFEDEITPNDTPVQQYLKASKIIDGHSTEWHDARNKIIQIMSKYEGIIQGGLKSSSEEYIHAVNDYYNLFSQLRKDGKIKGTFSIVNDNDKLALIENRLNDFETRLDKFEAYLKKLVDESGV